MLCFINRLKLIRRATNLFDNKTLAIHPASTIFGPFTDKQRTGHGCVGYDYPFLNWFGGCG